MAHSFAKKDAREETTLDPRSYAPTMKEPLSLASVKITPDSLGANIRSDASF
jgi:hypothetical protein